MSECTERRFSNGERVRCHPDGRRVLIRDRSPLREKLDAAQEDNCCAHTELKQRQRERLCKAKDSLDAGNSVPHEKRCI